MFQRLVREWKRDKGMTPREVATKVKVKSPYLSSGSSMLIMPVTALLPLLRCESPQNEHTDTVLSCSCFLD